MSRVYETFVFKELSTSNATISDKKSFRKEAAMLHSLDVNENIVGACSCCIQPHRTFSSQLPKLSTKR